MYQLHYWPTIQRFQIGAGLRYAFPRLMQRIESDYSQLLALHAPIAAEPRIAAYLASERRVPLNEDGIFRHYEELDDPINSGSAAPSAFSP